MGGSGTFSDGKLNLNPEIGGNLLEFTSRSDAERLISYIDNILIKHGVPPNAEIHPKAEELSILSTKYGIKFIPIKQKHVGSDHLPQIVNEIKRELLDMKVEILLEQRPRI